MDARVPNVTTYLVRVDGNVAGPITIVAGDGELELNNNNGKTLPVRFASCVTPAAESGRGQSGRSYAPVRPPRAPPSPNGGYVRGWITFRSKKKSRS